MPLLWFVALGLASVVGTGVALYEGSTAAEGFLNFFGAMVQQCVMCNIVGSTELIFNQIGLQVYQLFANEMQVTFSVLMGLFVLWEATKMVAPIFWVGGPKPHQQLAKRLLLMGMVVSFLSTTGSQLFDGWLITPVESAGYYGAALAVNKIETTFANGASNGSGGSFDAGGVSSIPNPGSGGSGGGSAGSTTVSNGGCDGSANEEFQFTYMGGGAPSSSNSTSSTSGSGHFLCGLKRMQTMTAAVVAVGGRMITFFSCDSDGNDQGASLGTIPDLILRVVGGVVLISIYIVFTVMLGFYCINPQVKIMYAVALAPFGFMVSMWPRLDTLIKRLISTVFSASLQVIVTGIAFASVGVLLSMVPAVVTTGQNSGTTLQNMVSFFGQGNCSQTVNVLSYQYVYLVFVGLLGMGMLAKTGGVAESLLQSLSVGDVASDAGRKVTEKAGEGVGSVGGFATGGASAGMKIGGGVALARAFR